MSDTTFERVATSVDTERWIGADVTRIEDERLLRAQGRFVDDIDPPGLLHMAVGRCPYPHARIDAIDPGRALELEGVVGVMIGSQVRARTRPLTVLRPLPDVPGLPFFAMADGIALYEGHAVVTVVATERAVAEDALELVEIDYEPLPHVVDVEDALDPGAPVLWEALESNLVVSTPRDRGDAEGALARADVRCGGRVRVGRVTGLPMEGRAVLAEYTPGLDTLRVWSSTQVPHLHRMQLADALGMPEERIRLAAPDVGGGFGLKLGLYPEDVLACLHAIDTRRPVKWVEDRMEHFRATTHAREALHDVEIGMTADGTITAMRDRYYVDMGAYNSPFGSPMLSSLMFPGPYRVKHCSIERNVVATNKTPVGAYRGYGQPESNFVRETLVDRAARRLGLDPVEVRRHNAIRPDEMPYESAGGAVYDSGDYRAALDAACERIGYDEFRRAAPARRDDGRRLGIGVACFVEMTGYPGSKFLGKHNAAYGAYESVTIRMNRSGGADLYTGIASFGQANETAFAQVCASVLGIHPYDVVVHAGDTEGTPHNVGAFASRTTIAGTGAVLGAAHEVRAKTLRVAGFLLGVAPEDLTITDAIVHPLDRPDDGIPLSRVAVSAISGHHLPDGEEPGLEATKYFDPPASAFGYGTAAAIVAVDERTGEFDVERFVLAHDCGRQVNPTLVEGQLHGGLAQGFGAALFEELRYDRETGQLLNGTMLDYLMPTAADLPHFELVHTDVASPVTPLGVRGVGEAGTIPPASAIANAICDALAPLPVEIDRLPITPERVWRAIRRAADALPSNEVEA
ncbi:MAG: xanthine dehydrogenase family protein molybdopterin-binding subunit [Acidimicrobiia bacterium]|nr:xanthine dehydrogenase family protein molybdopterin-binding subunit [Acidimicrobiia bacterium]